MVPCIDGAWPHRTSYRDISFLLCGTLTDLGKTSGMVTNRACTSGDGGGVWPQWAALGSPTCRPPNDTGGYVRSLARRAVMPNGGLPREIAEVREVRGVFNSRNPMHLCWYGVRMRLSPILPVSLAVAAVALSASQGHTVVEPDKRANHGVVAFPLFALKASDRIISSNNHYSHESHSSHSSHVSGGHSSHVSHFSSAPSSPPAAPITTASAPVAGSPTVTSAPPASGSSAAPVPSGSVPAPSGSGGSPISSFSPSPTGNDSSGGDAAPAVLAVLVVTVAGGVTYTVYRRRRPR
jgi:hypothetical protein